MKENRCYIEILEFIYIKTNCWYINVPLYLNKDLAESNNYCDFEVVIHIDGIYSDIYLK